MIRLIKSSLVSFSDTWVGDGGQDADRSGQYPGAVRRKKDGNLMQPLTPERGMNLQGGKLALEELRK